MAGHQCTDNLTNLRTYAHTNPGVWYCNECDALTDLWEVVEALRVRAVARDTVYRQRLVDVFPA